jgi:hypothetical protein
MCLSVNASSEQVFLKKINENAPQLPGEIIIQILSLLKSPDHRLTCQYVYQKLKTYINLNDAIVNFKTFVTLSKIKNCYSLYLSNTSLSEMDVSNWDLPSRLKILNLNWNGINDCFLKKLRLPKTLEKLYLENNQLTGECFGKWDIPTTLKLLMLGANPIESRYWSQLKLPDNLETYGMKLSSIEFLDLSKFRRLKSLTLNLSGEEKIKRLSNIVFPKQLEILNLSYNEITELKFVFPDSIKELDLSYNKLSNETLIDSVLPANLIKLNLCHNMDRYSIFTFDPIVLLKMTLPKGLKSINLKDSNPGIEVKKKLQESLPNIHFRF